MSTKFISFRRRGVLVGEQYFEEPRPETLPKVDLLRVGAVLEPSAGKPWKKLHTLLVDLQQDPDELLGQMSKNTRYKVRRAMDRDGLTADLSTSPAAGMAAEFADYYDEFATSKGLALVFRPRLEALADAGMLVLSRVALDGEPPLAWHAYAGSGERGMLLYSASVFRGADDSSVRNMIGRANRYLHWHDMLELKGAGYRHYDLGGVDVDGRDPETARIAEFKRGLGGDLRPTYAYSAPRSVKGRLVHAVLRVRGSDY